MSTPPKRVSSRRRFLWPILALLMAIAIWFDSRTTNTTPLPVEPAQRSDVTRGEDSPKPSNAPRESVSSRDEAPAPAPSASTAPASSALTLIVREADGTPVDGARYIVVDATRAVQRGLFDARGEAQMIASEGQGELFVQREAMLTRSIEVNLSPGQRDVTLPAMFAVAGSVTVGGATPVELLSLTLTHANAFPARDDLPEDVRKELAGEVALTTTTTPRGGFAFGGLSADWSGTLMFPRGFAVSMGERTGFGSRRLTLDRPQSDLSVDLERLPHLVGRVVDSLGEPVQKLTVTGTFAWADNSQMMTSADTDESGRFAFALKSTVFLGCQLRAEHALAGRLEHDVDVSRLGPDLDLGTLTMSAVSELRLRVVDNTRTPVAGARARLDGTNSWSTTDEQGRASVSSVASSTAQLRVLAHGFRAGVVPLSLPSDEVLEVKLTPANQLTITVFEPERKLARGVSVMIGSVGRPLFADNNSWYTNDTMIGLIAGVQQSASQDVGPNPQGWIVVVPDEKALVRLQGVTAGLSIDVAVLDALGRKVLEQSIEPLGETEHRELELVLDRPLRILAGIVRDADGAALAGASVALERTSEPTTSEAPITTTDAEGKFELIALSVPTVSLTAHRTGFAKARIVDVALDAPTTHVEIVLRRGRSVAVEVVDEQGSAVEHGKLRAKSAREGTTLDVRKLGAGRFEVPDAPTDELELELQLAGRRFTLRNFPTDPSARFVVPVLGGLAITFTPPADAATTSYLYRLRSADPETAVQERVLGDPQQTQLEFRPLLPGDYTLTLERLRVGQPSQTIGSPLPLRITPGAPTTFQWPP